MNTKVVFRGAVPATVCCLSLWGPAVAYNPRCPEQRVPEGRPCKTPRQIKNTEKAKRRFWRKEVKAAKSGAGTYERLRQLYPDIAWLNGL